MKKANRLSIFIVGAVVIMAIMIALVGTCIFRWETEAVYAEPGHTHDDITFVAWESNNALPNSAGNYYLTQDVTISSAWSAPSGTTNLCLNGFGIKQTGYDCVINVGSGITLNIYDCSDKVHYFDIDSVDQYAININEIEGSGRQSFTGGYIAGGNQHEGAGIHVLNGTVNMYGGNIIGNRGDNEGNGGGVLIGEEWDEYQYANGSFNLYGGSISYNYNNAGAGVYVFYKSTFTLNGGSVDHNHGGWAGGIFAHGNVNISSGTVANNTVNGGTAGICAFGHDEDNTNYVIISGGSIINNTSPTAGVGGIEAPVRLSGNPIISNNTANGNPSNLKVGDTAIGIVGSLANTQNIGITLASSTGVFTSGWNTYMPTIDPANYFVSDGEHEIVAIGGEVYVHDHDYGDLVAATATCESDGMAAHYHCDGCGMYFDENKHPTTVAALQRSAGHHLVHYALVEPTCTEMGKKEHFHCTECDKYFDVNMQEVASNQLYKFNIGKLDHDYDLENIVFTWTEDSSKTYGWSATYSYKCKRCGDTKEGNAEISNTVRWTGEIRASVYVNSKYYYSEPKYVPITDSYYKKEYIGEWTPWEYDDHLPTEAQPDGSQGWYLTKDVTLTDTWTIPQAVAMKLCLNGHVIKGDFNTPKPVIYISAGSSSPYKNRGTLYLYEYNFSETHYYYIGKTVTDLHGKALDFVGQIVDSENDPNYIAAARKGSFNGGYIAGGSGKLIDGSTYGGAVYVAANASDAYYNAAEFTLEGATIFGNYADNGGGVYVAEKAYFSLKSGNIIGNQAGNAGGGVYVNKRTGSNTTYEYGNYGMYFWGKLQHNTAGQSGNGYGGGAYGWNYYYASSNVTGNAAIGANAKGGGVYGFVKLDTANICDNYVYGTNAVAPGAYIDLYDMYLDAVGEFHLYNNHYTNSFTINNIGVRTDRYGDVYFASGRKAVMISPDQYPTWPTEGVKSYVEMADGTGSFSTNWNNSHAKGYQCFGANVGYKITESGTTLSLVNDSTGNINVNLDKGATIYRTYYAVDSTNTTYTSDENHRYVFSGTKTLGSYSYGVYGYNKGENNIYLRFSNLNLTANENNYIFSIQAYCGNINVYIDLEGTNVLTTNGDRNPFTFSTRSDKGGEKINIYFTGDGTLTYHNSAIEPCNPGKLSQNIGGTYSDSEVHVYKGDEDITIYERVAQKIQEIGYEVTFTKEIRTRIETARAAYDTLESDELREKVVNRNYLFYAEEAYILAAVQGTINYIDSIPDPITLTPECKVAIDAAREAYNYLAEDEVVEKLTPDVPQNLVTNYQKLVDAELRYATIQQDEWDKLVDSGIAIPDDLTYDGNAKVVTLTYNETNITVNIVYQKKNANGEYEVVTSCVNAGDYKASIYSAVNGEPVNTAVTFTITKAPAPAPSETPDTIDVGANWTLAEVELPDGWRWVDDLTTQIGATGVHQFEAVYNPDDANYLDSDPVTVTLTIKHIHNSITFTAWTSTDSLPTEAGNYYLENDVTLSTTWTVPSGTTNLCLNGHGIIMANADQSVVTVNDGAVLNIYDCGDTIHYFDVNSNNCAQNINETEGSGRESFIGGYITGGQGTDLGSNRVLGGGFFVNGGYLHMYGGTVIGNYMTRQFVKGAGVWVGYGGTFIMEEGVAIQYNFSDNVGGGVCVGVIFAADSVGTFVMNGGEISNNRAAAGGGIMLRAGQITLNGGVIAYNSVRDSGGAIDFEYYSYSTLQIGGNPVINNNFKYTSGVDDNIVLRGGDTIPTIEISSKLTSSANIYLIRGNGFSPTTAKAGVFIDGWSSVMGDAKPSDYFHSDNQDNAIYLYQDKVYFGPQPHLHEDIMFTAWTSTDSLPTEAGNYYLTNDVAIDSTWEVPSGTTNLCLNGHGITMTGSGSVISVGSGITFNLYDCDSSTTYYYIVESPKENGAGLATICDEDTYNVTPENARGTFTGGYITGGNADKGAGINVNGATVSIKGGTIIGNSAAAHGGGGIALTGGTLAITGGVIKCNEVLGNGAQGGGVCLTGNSTINMTGGVIELNVSEGCGGGIQINNNNSGSVIAGGIIRNNYTAQGGGINAGPSFTFTGGVITGNIATGNNSGGGVFAGYDLIMSGSATIQGNMKSSTEPSDIVLWHTYLVLESSIPASNVNPIVIGRYNGASQGVLTDGWTTYMDGLDPNDYFVSDKVDYAIFIKDDEVNYDIAIASVTNGEKVVKYETIDSAVSAWVDGTTLTLLTDVNITQKIFKQGIPSLTLDLNGKTITLNSSENEQRVIQISGLDCALNIIDTSGINAGRLTGVNPGASDNGWSGALYINSGAIVNMYGGTISGNASINGAGVWIDGRGHVGQAQFNMYGGLISGNTATNGGGVYVGCQLNEHATTAYFNMYGGTITDNTATNGSNVYVDHGIMTMIGGTINGGVEHSNISDDYVVITFDANDGTGTMSAQYVLINTDTKIKDNEYYNLEAVKCVGYTNGDYPLIGWNTQADGLGDKYTPGESNINISADITLYAQWKEKTPDKWTIKIKPKSSLSINPDGIIEDNEKIVRVYDVTLYRISIVDGVEQEPVMAQPSDIGPNATITVKFTIPDILVGKNFRILHVHAVDDYEFVTYIVDTEGSHVTIANIDRLFDFAFVALESDVTPVDPGEGGEGGEGGGDNNPIEPAPTKEDDPNIENWTLTPKDSGGESGQGEGGETQKPTVEVALEDCEPQEGVSLEIEVRADISQEIVEADNSVLVDRMQSDDEIAIVYDVKLIRVTTDPITGMELREEIQPSDVKPDAVVVINMEIPENLRGKTVKVLHIHAEDDINEIPASAYTISEDGRIITVRVTRLSEFALLGKKADEGGSGTDVPEEVGPNKLPDWAIALIVIGGSLALLGIGILLFFFIKCKKNDDNNKPTEKVIPIIKEEKSEEKTEVEEIGIGLKESISIATSAKRQEKITKAFINAYLSKNYPDVVEINTRDNYTKTGLPLADTHYVKDKNGKMVCFIYVFETDGATMLLLKTKDALGKELEKEYKNARKSAFPKSSDRWSSVVIDDSLSDEQVLDMLDRTIAVYTGAVVQKREQEGLGLKESLAVAASATRSEKITKAFINAYLAKKYPDVVEINTRENYTKTGLPLADTHYVTTIEGKKICFIYVYETDGATMLLLKTKEALGEELAKDYKMVNMSAFPKAKEKWYSVIIDDSLTDETVKYMIDRTIALYTGATVHKKVFAPVQTVKTVTVAEAIKMIEDDVATSAIVVEKTGERAIGKKGIINIDTLSNNFKNEDVVTIDALKAKKLIPNKVGYVKLLARGSLDKKLNVELQDYSIEAVKMIIATGGTVKKV